MRNEGETSGKVTWDRTLLHTWLSGLAGPYALIHYGLFRDGRFRYHGKRIQPGNGRRDMIIFDEERPSDSPFVQRIWSSHSECPAPVLSVAVSPRALVGTKV